MTVLRQRLMHGLGVHPSRRAREAIAERRCLTGGVRTRIRIRARPSVTRAMSLSATQGPPTARAA